MPNSTPSGLPPGRARESGARSANPERDWPRIRPPARQRRRLSVGPGGCRGRVTPPRDADAGSCRRESAECGPLRPCRAVDAVTILLASRSFDSRDRAMTLGLQRGLEGAAKGARGDRAPEGGAGRRTRRRWHCGWEGGGAAARSRGGLGADERAGGAGGCPGGREGGGGGRAAGRGRRMPGCGQVPEGCA
jgi:hypothetical protein